MELRDRLNDIEDCNISTSFCQSLGKGQTTSSCPACHQRGATFKSKLKRSAENQILVIVTYSAHDYVGKWMCDSEEGWLLE